MSTPIIDLNVFVANAQQQVYDYFASFCGTVNCPKVNQFKRVYENKSIKELKKCLKQLKLSLSVSNKNEISYVSKLLRQKLSKSSCDETEGLNHNF